MELNSERATLCREKIATDHPEGTGWSKCFTRKNAKDDMYSGRHQISYPRPYVCRKNEQNDSNWIYNMNTYPRGKLVIINEKDFDPSTKLHTRIGTEKDVERLTQLFLELGYIVECFDNLTTQEIFEALVTISNESFEQLSSLICAILSHGKEDGFYSTDGTVNIKSIAQVFCNANLQGKPKILFIQACQGSEYMVGSDEIDYASELAHPLNSQDNPDFLYAYSVVKGYRAWRNDKNGTWFIELLTEMIRKFADKLDLVKILSRVNYQLALRRSHTMNEESNNKRQIASIDIQLFKDFYFFPPFLIVKD